MPKIKTGELFASRMELFKRNAGIDLQTVAAHERLERELKELGVEIKPSYNLEPPLGSGKPVLHNRSR